MADANEERPENRSQLNSNSPRQLDPLAVFAIIFRDQASVDVLHGQPDLHKRSALGAKVMLVSLKIPHESGTGPFLAVFDVSICPAEATKHQLIKVEVDA